MQFRTSPFITPEELSERWKGAISTRTLANWRWKRAGPQFIKPGGKVLYRIDQVEAWEAQHMPVVPCGADRGRSVARFSGLLIVAGIAAEWAISPGGIIANDNAPDRGAC